MIRECIQWTREHRGIILAFLVPFLVGYIFFCLAYQPHEPEIRLEYCNVCDERFNVHIEALELNPRTLYTLCLNGKPGHPGNELLGRVPGSKQCGNEIFINFGQFRTNDMGHYRGDHQVQMEMPNGTYDVKLLIKDQNKNEKTIATCDYLIFEIDHNVNETYTEEYMQVLESDCSIWCFWRCF